jgi:hypothetical protein
MQDLLHPLWRISDLFVTAQVSIQQVIAHRHHTAAMKLFSAFLIILI